MTKQFNWHGSYDASLRAEMPNEVTLVVTPEHTKEFGMKPKRGTTWRAQASQWDEATRTISRFGRDAYREQHKTKQDAMRAAERIYLDAVTLSTIPLALAPLALPTVSPRRCL